MTNSAYGYKIVTVRGYGGHKYTNPGGFVHRDGKEFVVARRVKAEVDMATDEARASDIVLLEREGKAWLRDNDEVFLRGDPERGLGYEDPRVLLDDEALTFTFLNGDQVQTWVLRLDCGRPARSSFPVGPPVSPAKNGYVFESSDGSGVVVTRFNETNAIQFYQFDTLRSAFAACSSNRDMEWWQPHQRATLEVPNWLAGEQGKFSHAGFGTIVTSHAAILHFARANEGGKYYVTALQRLDDAGMPEGPPEIIAEPAKDLPHGDVPNVIYTTMAWLQGAELVLWSGHDDSYIMECRCKAPKWLLED
jgi:predicted GH43/DUF377 family glycosyl hydrolase